MRPRRVSEVDTDIMHGYIPQGYIHDNPWSVVAATAAIHVSRTAGSPRVPRAARVREAEKVGKYTPYLRAGDPPHTFTLLVWEASGGLGPATASFLASALGEENLREALSGLLTNVSLSVWLWNARIFLVGVANYFRMGGIPLAAPPLVAHFSHEGADP